MQALIADFMERFYGYGNLKGRYWFIGMEEGCGPIWETDVAPRFEEWDTRKRKQTEDLRAFHLSIGIKDHWEPAKDKPLKIQFTWRRLIETILTVKGDAISKETIAKYQSQHLGVADGDDCLLELLPLPSPNSKKYIYGHLTNEAYPYFASRSQYRKKVMDTRLAGLRRLISEHHPHHVVLYGLSYGSEWNKLVMNAEWEPVNNLIKRCRLSESYIWLVPHPAARNLPTDLFVILGEKLKAADQVSQRHA